MNRRIIGFFCDEEGHWVARLSCFHGQHVRHDPPMVSRPWVLSEEGRADKLGQLLDCLRCDRAEWPEELECYRRTPPFDAQTVPDKLRGMHSTKDGVWGRLIVLAGSVRLIDVSGRIQDVELDRPGIIVPALEHRVEMGEGARFAVEFYRGRTG